MQHLINLFFFGTVRIRHCCPHGGPSGGQFNDLEYLKLGPMASCIGVELFWNSELLFAIRFIYQQENSSIPEIYRGGDGKPSKNIQEYSLHNEKFIMNGSERIDKITWYKGTNIWRYNRDGDLIEFVLGIQFHTTFGRTSVLYGISKGAMYEESYEGYILGYATGRSGLLVDMLQFVWYHQVVV